MSSQIDLDLIASLLSDGKVIAYPTESCFGLGCDPDNEHALNKILTLKQRSIEQGVIIIGDSFHQLQQYCHSLTTDEVSQMENAWPGPTTYIVPSCTHHWLRGKHSSIGIRVPGHDLARQICTIFAKPIVSTSANPHGLESAKTASMVRHYFHDQVDYIIDEAVGGRLLPSQIVDLKTGKILR